MVVQIARTRTFSQAHETTEAAERAARAVFPDADVDLVLHMEPAMAPDEGIDDTIRYRARESGLRVHNVRVTQTAAGGVEADVHVEADPALTLEQTYALAKDLEGAVRRDMPDLHAFNAHLEVLNPSIERRVEVTATHPTLVARVRAIADGIAGPGASHTLHVYRPSDEGGQPRMGGSDQGDPAAYDLVLHVAIPGDQPLPAVHERAEEIERALRAAFPALAHVLIETEPAA
jgi:hypothetical protein